MRKSRFQNKVATGKFTLPVAAVFATLLWGAEGIYTPDRLWGWVACGLTDYLWVETNNANSLIRIRSRLTPALYLFMAGCIFGLHPLQDGTLAALFMLASYYLLFKSYQETEAVGLLFHAFLSVGGGQQAVVILKRIRYVVAYVVIVFHNQHERAFLGFRVLSACRTFLFGNRRADGFILFVQRVRIGVGRL